MSAGEGNKYIALTLRKKSTEIFNSVHEVHVIAPSLALEFCK